MKQYDEIEKIMNSLDGISRAEAKPFMHTRVTARLQTEEKNIWAQIGSFIAQPVVAIATVIVILIMNYFIINSNEGVNQENNNTISASNSASELWQNDNYILAVNNYETNTPQ